MIARKVRKCPLSPFVTNNVVLSCLVRMADVLARLVQKADSLSALCSCQCNPPPPTPTPGKYGALAIKQNQTVIMPHIQGPLILSNPLPNMNKFPHPRAKLRLICHMQIKLPTESVCARLAQLVTSLTAKQNVPGSIPHLVEG